MIGRFSTPSSYRQALEARLLAAYGPERVQRGRKRLAIERLIVRLQEQQPSGFLVKGGFALELRLAGQARTTRDLDLAADAELGSDLDSIATQVDQACAIDVRDGFEFRPAGVAQEVAVSSSARTLRFSIRGVVAGRHFETVPLDIRLGDLFPRVSDILPGSDILQIIELSRPAIRVITLEYQVAEKIHALTLPRSVGNTRIRDLVDLVLLIHLGALSNGQGSAALQEVFDHRATHVRPAEMPRPPSEWHEGYALVAKQLPRVPAKVGDAWEIVAEFYKAMTR